MNENEIWKAIEGYEGYYEVSNLGNVRSLDRVISGRHAENRIKGRVLLPSFNQRYPSVEICRDGKNKRVNIHRLVAKAFIDNPLVKECVNHIDGVKTNNKVENLEWVTHQENISHSVKTGLCDKRNDDLRGELNVISKLTDEKVRFIRKHSFKNGGSLTYSELARRFGVERGTIRNADTGYTWSHIK